MLTAFSLPAVFLQIYLGISTRQTVVVLLKLSTEVLGKNTLNLTSYKSQIPPLVFFYAIFAAGFTFQSLIVDSIIIKYKRRTDNLFGYIARWKSHVEEPHFKKVYASQYYKMSSEEQQQKKCLMSKTASSWKKKNTHI